MLANVHEVFRCLTRSLFRFLPHHPHRHTHTQTPATLSGIFSVLLSISNFCRDSKALLQSCGIIFNDLCQSCIRLNDIYIPTVRQIWIPREKYNLSKHLSQSTKAPRFFLLVRFPHSGGRTNHSIPPEENEDQICMHPTKIRAARKSESSCVSKKNINVDLPGKLNISTLRKKHIFQKESNLPVFHPPFFRGPC